MFITKKMHNKIVKAKKREITELRKENLVVHEENKELRFENEEQTNLINNIIRELYSNIKTDEQKIAKIKELVNDYQSIN